MAHIKRYFNSRTAFTSAVTIIILAALALRINLADKHCVPAGDEGAWLRIAAVIPSADFMTSRVIEHDHYFERQLPHPEDNRSPLYPAIIAAFRLIAPDPFDAGQLLSLAVFILLALSLTIYMQKRFGKFSALSSLTFISFSPFIINYSVRIYPDLLAALLFLIFLVNNDKILQSKRSSFAGGIFIAILFLIKSTAVFLFVPLTAELVFFRRNREGVKNYLLLTLCFFMLSSPWLIRNYIVFGSPLHQVSKYTLYMESWSTFFNTGMELPSLSRYLEEKGFIHVFFTRPVSGFLKMAMKFPWFDHDLSLWLLPFSTAGLIAVRHCRRLLRPFLFFSLFYIPFMAYIAQNSWVARYIMVYYIIIYCLAGIGINRIINKLRRKNIRLVFFSVFTVLPLITVAYPVEFYLSERGSEAEIDNAYRTAIKQISKIIPDSSVILSSFLSQYSFMHDFYVVNALNFKDAGDMAKFIDIYSIDYVLLEEGDRLWEISREMKKKYNISEIFSEKGIVLERIGNYKLENGSHFNQKSLECRESRFELKEKAGRQRGLY